MENRSDLSNLDVTKYKLAICRKCLKRQPGPSKALFLIHHRVERGILLPSQTPMCSKHFSNPYHS